MSAAIDIEKLEPHRLSIIFPMLGDEEINDLADDIRQNGLRAPIVLFEGKILDGRNRLAACKIAGYEPKFVEFEGTGLRADCLDDPRMVWRAALNHCAMHTRKGEVAARKWAYGVWSGVYPNNKLPRGWFDAPIPVTVDPSAVSLIEREIKRFRKQSRRAAA